MFYFSLVCRVIPPRAITRKAVDGLQARLDSVEIQLKRSQEENQRINSILFQAKRELDAYRKGERNQELERRLQELELRLESSHHPSIQNQDNPRRSSDQSVIPIKPRRALWYPSTERSQHDRSSNSFGNVQMEPESQVPMLDSYNTQSRRRAATTGVSSRPVIFNYSGAGYHEGLNISLGSSEEDQLGYRQRSDYDGLPRSQSVSSGSNTAPFYPPSPQSLPFSSPSTSGLYSSLVTSHSSPATIPDSTMEPCYLINYPFINSTVASPTMSLDNSRSEVSSTFPS